MARFPSAERLQDPFGYEQFGFLVAYSLLTPENISVLIVDKDGQLMEPKSEAALEAIEKLGEQVSRIAFADYWQMPICDAMLETLRITLKEVMEEDYPQHFNGYTQAQKFQDVLPAHREVHRFFR